MIITNVWFVCARNGRVFVYYVGLASAVGIGVEVTQSDLRALMYVPKPNEWPRGDREAECVRIIRGFEQIMQLSVAEQFLAPVDLNEFPDYAMMIAYPMDLSLIVARLHNRFYRFVMKFSHPELNIYIDFHPST